MDDEKEKNDAIYNDDCKDDGGDHENSNSKDST